MTVRVEATASGVVLYLDHGGRIPILEAISLELTGRGDESLTTTRLGVGPAGARRVLEKLNGPATEFSLQEIHVMAAALCSALALLPSEQDFHERLGAFKEEALELTRAIVRGASADPGRPPGCQTDEHVHPSEMSEGPGTCGEQ